MQWVNKRDMNLPCFTTGYGVLVSDVKKRQNLSDFQNMFPFGFRDLEHRAWTGHFDPKLVAGEESSQAKKYAALRPGSLAHARDDKKCHLSQQ